MQESADAPLIEQREELSAWLSDEANQGKVVRTHLKTSDRVIARVTDGIYRQPASAFRELISNAWDADANQVTILTDAPRFSRIYIRDDGVGMSYEVLSRLLHSIGGSAKRRSEGQKLGVVAADDPERTPGGRLIIGKIGIGLFSISQLARRFRIITKVRGEAYRLVAEVSIRAYSEDDDVTKESEESYVSGNVLITREHSNDLDAHGTDIILEEVKPRVRDMLRSADRWRALDEKAAAERAGDTDTVSNIRVEQPKYHTGWIEHLSPNDVEPAVLSRAPTLPWSSDTPADLRMELLMDAIEQESKRTERPDLAKTLDTYLETLWTLALSTPVKYVGKHPFELTADSGIDFFWISNETRGQSKALLLDEGMTVREAIRQQVPGYPELEDGKTSAVGEFRVLIDGVELKRPIRFRPAKSVGRAIGRPMLFIGRYAPDLTRVDPFLRGGTFGLEGYLFWNGMVIPKENNGVLIRIRGTAGALFDSTFFKYQVSEQNRLRGITSELFIKRGLDAALNIDRESFNFSHPHVQFVVLWLHRAIRQLTNKHKEISKRARTEKREKAAGEMRDAVTRHSEFVWESIRGSEPSPDTVIESEQSRAEDARANGYLALTRQAVPSLSGNLSASEQADREVKAQALMRVLAAYDVLSERSYEEQHALVEAILRVFFTSPEK